jgi:hypothetical protein
MSAPAYCDQGLSLALSMFQILKQCMERLSDYLANCSAKIKAIKGVFSRVGTYIQRWSKFCFVVLVLLADTLIKILHYCPISTLDPSEKFEDFDV